MQIVIDIPKDFYNQTIEHDRLCWEYMGMNEMAKAIKKGTPLPKGHGRLIDENNLWFEDIDDISCVTQRNVENAPTIIEADRVGSEE